MSSWSVALIIFSLLSLVLLAVHQYVHTFFRKKPTIVNQISDLIYQISYIIYKISNIVYQISYINILNVN